MGDHQDSPVCKIVLQGVHDFFSCGPVKPRKGLVQQQDRGGGGKGKGEQQALALSAGQAGAILSQRGVEFLRQGMDLIGQSGLEQCGPDRVLRKCRMEALEICPQTVTEDVAGLRGRGKMAADRRTRKAGIGCSLQEELAGGRFPEAAQ